MTEREEGRGLVGRLRRGRLFCCEFCLGLWLVRERETGRERERRLGVIIWI